MRFEHNLKGNRISKTKRIKNKLLATTMFLCRIFPIKNNKIVFRSNDGKDCHGEPGLIFEKLMSKTQYDFVWIINRESEQPDNARAVNQKSLRKIYELATARIWIDNVRKVSWVNKRKEQFYIQTWHGPMCIKAVEKDAEDTLEKQYILNAKQDSKNADIIVAETKWRVNNIRNAFWYEGKILEAEFKRNKKTIEESRRNVKEYFKIKKEEKIVLYAPTFRKEGNLDCYALDCKGLLGVLEERGEKWKIVIRLHPNITEKNVFINYSESILDGSSYPDVDDLINVSSLIITDYSGIIFEGFKSKKIVCLFAMDLDKYTKSDRDLYFDIKNLPSPLAQNNEQLIYNIRNFDVNDYEEKREHFINEMGYFDDDAAERCAELIVKTIEGY